MKYQLVLQFRADSLSGFDELVALEESLTDSMLAGSEIDGHDFGNGEFNIFVLTDTPEQCFRSVEQTIQKNRHAGTLRAAYRKIEQDTFVGLWPSDLGEFKIS